MSAALILSALGALALTSGIALAAADPMPMGDMTRAQALAMADRQFDRLDVNKDGRVDKADRDAMHARMAAEMFDRADTNKDGVISRDEWTAASAKLADRGPPPPPGAAGPDDRAMPGGPMMRRMAMKADGDGDRAVTRQEFEARALARFDRMDTNKDGKISAEEREQAHAAMREHVERP